MVGQKACHGSRNPLSSSRFLGCERRGYFRGRGSNSHVHGHVEFHRQVCCRKAAIYHAAKGAQGLRAGGATSSRRVVLIHNKVLTRRHPFVADKCWSSTVVGAMSVRRFKHLQITKQSMPACCWPCSVDSPEVGSLQPDKITEPYWASA